MFNLQSVIEQALQSGFSFAGVLNYEALEFMSDVRDMCAADRCRNYGKNWSCPPAFGSLEESVRRASKYKRGILVQTVGNLDDDFDYETMEATGKIHNARFLTFVDDLKKNISDLLPMGAGTCTLCEKCTYPDEPCRFPERMIVSMEAYGLLIPLGSI